MLYRIEWTYEDNFFFVIENMYELGTSVQALLNSGVSQVLITKGD